jgi:glycosyltransferase involved in cell wall biosynthesis
VSGTRVLRVYHSAVVAEYRERDRLLRSRHGYDLHVVSPPAWNEGGSLVTASHDDAVPLHVIAARGRQHPILFWYASAAFRRVLREVRPEIVDLHEEPYSLATAAALWAVDQEVPDARVCVYSAQNILKRFPPPVRHLEQRALRRAVAAYPCSTEAGDVLRAKGFTGSVHVLPLGVSLGKRPPRAFTEGPLTVGFLGRLESYKGGEVAIRAFASAAEGLDATLEVVGAGSQRAELEACAQQLGISSRVRFTGAVSQEEALTRIASYDAVLVPSLTTPTWKEQFGRIPVQALEAGTPVIASDSGSLREVLADCGELVPEGDVPAFADALRRLLRDPSTRADLSTRGRVRAAQEFAWEKVADGFDHMYGEMLQAPRPCGAPAPA